MIVTGRTIQNYSHGIKTKSNWHNDFKTERKYIKEEMNFWNIKAGEDVVFTKRGD